MLPIQIQLLGPPKIYYHQKLWLIQRQTLRAVFYYIAAQDTLVARDTLLELFWPNSPVEQARRRLRETLSRLRGELPLAEVLITTPDIAGVNSELVDVDLRTYHRLLQEIGNLPWKIPTEIPIPATVVQKMGRAASLWHGNHLLEGARLPSTPGFDAWLTSTDQQLIENQIRLLTRLAQHHAASGHIEQALSLLERAYQLDDLNEEVAVLLISWRMALGQRARAWELYDTVTARLKEELGLSPGPDLAQLREQMEVVHLLPDSVPEAQLSLRQTLEIPFVGRQQEMQVLDKALFTGGCVLIQGESGSGKTRLMSEFIKQRLTTRLTLVLLCRPTDADRPLQPFAEALNQAVRPSDWEQMEARWLQLLASWLPELRSQIAEQSESVKLQSAPPLQQLQEAIQQLFLLLGARQKLALIVEDIHWADEATISTVAYLLEHTPGDQKFLIILSGRLESPNPYLKAWLPHLVQEHNFYTIPLKGLDQTELLVLCLHTFGMPVPASFAVKLQHTTGGNPFFALETLRDMLEKGLSPLAPNPTLPTPRSVQELLTSRLQLVSMAAGRFIAVAAIYGEVFDPAAVQVIAELNTVQTARVLEELEQRALIEPADQGHLTYKFTHEHVREAVLSTLHIARKQALEHKVEEYLQANQNSE
jgi:DNA-binding SARP family transcriptional activator